MQRNKFFAIPLRGQWKDARVVDVDVLRDFVRDVTDAVRATARFRDPHHRWRAEWASGAPNGQYACRHVRPTEERATPMPAPYAESPGRWQFLSSQDGKAEMSWTPTPDMANPFGSVHGGIIATVIDEATGAALLPSIETPSAPTVSLNVEYLLLGPHRRDLHRAQRDRTKRPAMAIVDALVENEEGKVLARGTAFF